MTALMRIKVGESLDTFGINDTEGGEDHATY
jgi:hypothetical protein